MMRSITSGFPPFRVVLLVSLLFTTLLWAAPPQDKADEFWRLVEVAKKELESGNYSAALVSFNNAAKIDGRNVDVLKGMAVAQENLGDKLSAAATLLRLYNETPTDPESAFHSGELYEAVGKTDDAIGAYRKAVTTSPEHLKALRNMAELYTKKAAWQDAINTYKAILTVDPNLVEYNFRIATTYLTNLKDKENARRWLRETTKNDPGNDAAYQTLGRLMLESKLYSETADLMKEIVTLHPNVADNRYIYGCALESKGEANEALLEYRAAVAADAGHGEAWLGLGRTQLNLNMLEQGRIALDKAVNLLPNSAEAHFQLGRAMVMANQDSTAMNELEQAVRLDPKHTPAFTELGKLYIRLKRYNDAIRPLDSLYKLLPKDQYANYGLGLSYGKTGKESDGLRYFRQAYEIDPNDFATIRDYGELFLRLGKWDDATRMFNDALNRQSDEKGKIYMWLGDAHFGARRYPDAISAYRSAIDNDSKLMEAYYKLGNGYMAVDKPNDASVEYQHAINLDAGFIPARIGLGSSFEAQKRYPDAITAYEGAVRVDNKCVEGFEGWGRALYLDKQPEAAEETMAKALALNTKSFDGHYWTGRIYEDRKLYPTAADHYKIAVTVNLNHADCRIRLGILLIALKKPREATTPLEEACKLEPDNFYAHFYAARAYEEIENYDPGIAHYLECIRIRPDSLDSNHNLGNLYRYKKDYEKTIIYYTKVAELTPEEPGIYKEIGEVYRIMAFISKKWRRYNEELVYLDKAAENYQMYLALDLNAPDEQNIKDFLAGYEKYRVLQDKEREKIQFGLPW